LIAYAAAVPNSAMMLLIFVMMFVNRFIIYLFYIHLYYRNHLVFSL